MPHILQKPDGTAILFDGDAPPLNVTDNLGGYQAAGVPIQKFNQHEKRVDAHVKKLQDLYDARLAAADKVAKS